LILIKNKSSLVVDDDETACSKFSSGNGHVEWMLLLMHVVSSSGRASDYSAGGQGFEPQAGPTLRVLK